MNPPADSPPPPDSLGKRDATRAALRASVFKAVALIEARFDDPPPIAELARAAGLSRAHFQSAFRAVVGESVAQHTLRLRLERAAALLKFSSWQVGEIGLACGFETQASFGRGFKRLYGMTPLAFRKAEQAVPFLRGYLRSRPERELSDPAQPPITAYLEDWPDYQAAALRFYGSVAEIGEAWGELLAWAKHEVPDLRRARFFGLWFDEWNAGSEGRYRYECAIVPAEPLASPLPEPFVRRAIPAGQVAVAHARGRTAELDRAWRAFATGWLPFSGFQPRGEFALDEYPAEIMLGSALRKLAAGIVGLEIKMCLPVQSGPMAI